MYRKRIKSQELEHMESTQSEDDLPCILEKLKQGN
jgi:hypothetical protein